MARILQVDPQQALEEVFTRTQRLADALQALPDEPGPWLPMVAGMGEAGRQELDQYLGDVAMSFGHIKERIIRLRYLLRAKGERHA